MHVANQRGLLEKNIANDGDDNWVVEWVIEIQ
jgi:hypothetical protein